MLASISPLSTACEPPASPDKWEDTLLPLCRTLNYWTLAIIAHLLSAVWGAQQTAGTRVAVHLPRSAWGTRVLASWTRAGTQTIEPLATDVGTIGVHSYWAPGLAQTSGGALVVNQAWNYRMNWGYTIQEELTDLRGWMERCISCLEMDLQQWHTMDYLEVVSAPPRILSLHRGYSPPICNFYILFMLNLLAKPIPTCW